MIAIAVFGFIVIAYAINSSNTESYRASEKKLDEIVARHLNMAGNPVKEPNELTKEDYEKVKDMMIDIYDLSTLRPLEKLTNLKKIKFVLEWGDINVNLDFKPLARLKMFRELSFMEVTGDTVMSVTLGFATPAKKKWYNGIISLMQKYRSRSTQKNVFDLHKLKKLKNLESLEMGYLDTSNFEVLASFSKMRHLDLGGTKISDLTPISGLINLEYLGLVRTEIKNIDLLASLTNLKELNLGGTQISDIKALANLTKLEKLHLHGSKVTDISPIAKLTNLQKLDIYYSQISDITALEGLTNISELELWGTKIKDISPLKNLKKLQQIGLYNINTSEEQIAELQKALPDLKIDR